MTIGAAGLGCLFGNKVWIFVGSVRAANEQQQREGGDAGQ
jgi:hypothetical protein